MSPAAWRPRNTVIHGDCVEAMGRMAPAAVDFILTDPPYLVNYRDRSGRRVANDVDASWLKPAFAEMHRVLKPGSFCVTFYGWNKVDLFMDAWKAAGFRAVGHIVFRKRYASSTKYLRCEHECAFLLAKGDATAPEWPISDVIDFDYTGNRLHPTQKPLNALIPLIASFCPQDGLVLDPFCGSGSTLVAARQLRRDFLGVELDVDHVRKAEMRVAMPSVEAA